MFRSLMTVAFAAPLFACHVGNGVLAEVEREVEPFNAVEVGSGLRAEIVVGESEAISVSLEADANLVGDIQTVVQGKCLKIRLPLGFYRPARPAVAYVRVPSLRALGAVNGSSVRAQGINAKAFSLSASDQSLVEIFGETEFLVLTADGGARVFAKEFLAAQADLTVSGGSYVEVTVQQEVKIVATDGSRLRVAGSPSRNLGQQQEGGAQVTFE